jgi:twitching motility two-component system response regulator PilG
MLAKNRELPLVSISPKPLPLKLPTYRSIHPAKLGVSLLRTLNDLSETIAAHSTHVLVIDDSQLIREFMSMILEPLNVRVTLAEDGETGILRAKERPFDLIFLDVMMPEMDGYATCKALKQDPRTANVPVIMLTSKSSPFNKIKGSMSGCNRYLTKPVDNNKVVAVVDEFCGPGRKTS